MCVRQAGKAPRNEKGTAITEFAGSLVIFICFAFIPFVDMAFVPARYLLVSTYLENVVHHMALSEKRSDALFYLKNGSNFRAFVNTLGVNLHSADANLVVCDDSGATRSVIPGSTPVPDNMLPNSTNKPLVYTLELNVVADVPPLFGQAGSIPGFNKAIIFNFKNRYDWENLSPDPQSGTYFINE